MPLSGTFASTAQVAEALGVGVTTIKRWVDEGILPAQKTAGGHRKLSSADVRRLAREGRLPQADLSRLFPTARSTPATPDDFRERLGVAALGDDVESIRSTIVGAYHAGLAMEVIADKIIAPAMAQVGREWEAGRLAVIHEHRITQACVAAVFELKAMQRSHAQASRPLAIGGAPEGDHSTLASLLAAMALNDCGWESMNLGPHTPFSAFRSALDQFNPKLVWFSATHIADEATFMNEYESFYREAQARGIAVAVGGRALQESVRTKMNYTMFGDGLTQLTAFARTLNPPAQSPRRRSK